MRVLSRSNISQENIFRGGCTILTPAIEVKIVLPSKHFSYHDIIDISDTLAFGITLLTLGVPTFLSLSTMMFLVVD